MHEPERRHRRSSRPRGWRAPPPAARAAPLASSRPFPQPDPLLQLPSSGTSLSVCLIGLLTKVLWCHRPLAAGHHVAAERPCKEPSGWVRKLKRFRCETGSFVARKHRLSRVTKLDNKLPHSHRDNSTTV